MALIPNPTPGTVLQQGGPRVPGMVPATGNPGLAFNLAHPSLAPPGTSVGANGAIIANDTSFAQPGDTIVQMPDGSKTVLMKNGAVVTIPAPPSAPEDGGGGRSRPPPLKLPPPPKPQAIPGPKAVGASQLGAPNQTWDWLLEALAAPGLLAPSMQQLGFSLAQPATSNNMLPQISQPNFGGLFGTSSTPAPFTQAQMPSFFQGATNPSAPWQGSTLGPSFASRAPMVAPSPSGNLNLGSLGSLSSLLGPMAAGGSSRK